MGDGFVYSRDVSSGYHQGKLASRSVPVTPALWEALCGGRLPGWTGMVVNRWMPTTSCQADLLVLV